MSKVLVTGGVGFIGCHLVDKLVERGNEVSPYRACGVVGQSPTVVVDSLEEQVHTKKPDYLNPEAQYLFEDIRDESVLAKAVEDVEVIFHEVPGKIRKYEVLIEK